MDRPAVGFTCGNELYERCYELAIDTLFSNIKPWHDGLLTSESPAIMAGKTYTTPWTRDCAFNVWNAGALLAPEASRNTLLSTLIEDDGLVRIGGQYWDAISWVTGAWTYYCVTGDESFVELMYAATINSLRYFEETEFDADAGLFDGAASYGDGVAAYPEPYDDAGGSSGILDWPAAHPEVGKVRMKALSTNCLYHNAYVIAERLTELMDDDPEVSRRCRDKATALQQAIQAKLWVPQKQRYAYYVDHLGVCDEYMEGLGHSFVILLDVADESCADAVLSSQYVSEYGIPCVWPLFPRFQSEDGMKMGRHCGTVWPFIQAFWASAAARHKRADIVIKEMQALAEMADRHHEFKEIYHPITGEPEGGWQIEQGKMRQWASEPDQTWSATGYLRMVYDCVLGMRFSPAGLQFEPLLPKGFDHIELTNLPYRNASLDIVVHGPGRQVTTCQFDGEPHVPMVQADLTGSHRLEIGMA